MSFIQITSSGDFDYPLEASEGVAGSIEEIRKRCNKGSPYVDPDFPANDKSIGKAVAKTEAGDASFVWLRAHEICEKEGYGKPNFAVANANDNAGLQCSLLDIREGGLGDCYYLAALASVCTQPDSLNIVVPIDNYGGFEDNNYCGAFHFRFYNFYVAKFVDVVVDDLIPCKGSTLQPVFARPFYNKDAMEANEFWVVLLEKAFAKFRGNYGRIEAGYMVEAMEYMTGGCSGTWYFEDSQDPGNYNEYETKMKRHLDSKYFLALGTLHEDNEAEAGRAKESQRLGLVCGHAYGIAGGVEVKEKGTGQGRLLLQIQNPWGQKEWTGPFSDGDDNGWATMESDLRTRDAESGSTSIDQGTFWMDFRDVMKFFAELDYCAVGVGEGSKYCTVFAMWPANLQTAKIPESPPANLLPLCPAFMFEVRRELMRTVIPEEHAGKCVCSFRITMGEEAVYLYPVLEYMWLIYEIEEGDEERLKGDVTALEEFYERDYVEWSDGTFGEQADTASQPELYLKPGRYVLVLPPKTDGDPPVIPTDYVGKSIPLTLTLFTENETTLVPISSAFMQKPEEFVIVTYQVESNL